MKTKQVCVGSCRCQQAHACPQAFFLPPQMCRELSHSQPTSGMPRWTGSGRCGWMRGRCPQPARSRRRAVATRRSLASQLGAVLPGRDRDPAWAGALYVPGPGGFCDSVWNAGSAIHFNSREQTHACPHAFFYPPKTVAGSGWAHNDTEACRFRPPRWKGAKKPRAARVCLRASGFRRCCSSGRARDHAQVVKGVPIMPTSRWRPYCDFSVQGRFDRYEVTNRQYKSFVDAGGYQSQRFWKHRFEKDGHELSLGQQGPRQWNPGHWLKTKQISIVDLGQSRDLTAGRSRVSRYASAPAILVRSIEMAKHGFSDMQDA